MELTESQTATNQKKLELIIFQIDSKQYAVESSIVQRVVQIVQITPLLDEPDPIAGVINLHGRVIPVFKLRVLLSSLKKELDINDQFIIVNHKEHMIALWVDNVMGLFKCESSDQTSSKDIYENLHYVKGTILCDNKIVPHLDLETLLSEDMLNRISHHNIYQDISLKNGENDG